MSELLFYLRPEPAYQPIRVHDGKFWRGQKRFLIKGINYTKRERQPNRGEGYRNTRRQIDLLVDDRLDELRRDIALLHQLGLNTISVSALDPTRSHHAAFRLLAEAGLYVLVNVAEEGDRTPDARHSSYQPESVLRLVHELLEHPNVIGITVSGQGLTSASRTRNAEVMRAYVRDIKSFLELRAGGRVPVGVSLPDLRQFYLPALRYFTTNSPEGESNIDFFAIDNWGWVNPSSFQISGWRNLTEQFKNSPVPIFLNAYGARVQRARTWHEVECLYSPDMTGVFSGGCLHTFFEQGTEYGVLEDIEGTGLKRKHEFETLKRRFRTVNRRSPEEVFDTSPGLHTKGEITCPPHAASRWQATNTLPLCPVDWDAFMLELRDDAEGQLVAGRRNVDV